MASTATQVCNLALNMVPTANITSLADGSFAASKCAQEYPQALAELLEASDWGFAQTLGVLTQLVSNDRLNEWAYAYARPAGVGLIVRVMEPPDDTGSGLLAGQVPSTYDRVPLLGIPFVDAELTIYTNSPNALLLFTSDAAVSAWPGYFTRALAAKIAQRVTLPITKDRARKADRDQEAELLVARAINANLNREPQTYGDDFIPEAVLARAGYYG